MSPVMISLLPFIIGSALVPAQIVIVILLLKEPRQGLLNAAAFVGGMTTMRLLQGLIFGLILTDSAAASTDASGKNPIVLTLQLILGIMLLISALKIWRKEDDPDAPPPKWLTMLDSLTPFKAFSMGFVLMVIGAKFWVFTMGAIGVIAAAQLGQPYGTIAFLLFVLLAESLLLLSLVFRMLLPERSKIVLEKISTWMTRYNRPMMIGVSLVFGLWFFYQAASGLLGM
jgi:hypothetical protein